MTTFPAISVNSSVHDSIGAGTGVGYEFYDATSVRYYDVFELTNAAPGVPLSISTSQAGFDTILGVFNLDTGAQIAFNDDGGSGTNSALTFTPVFGDNYAIYVSSYGLNATGNYTLSIASA